MIPTNEQETIALFAQLARELGYQFKEMGTRCPDAILIKDEKEVRVEFEHVSRNFERHKHNPDDVDLIVCWRDDWDKCPLPVLSLEVYVTLARAEELPPELPKWQRFLNWWRYFQFERINCWTEIKKTRKRARAQRYCKVCGTPMKVECGRGEIDNENGLYTENTAYFRCPACDYNYIEISREYAE